MRRTACLYSAETRVEVHDTIHIYLHLSCYLMKELASFPAAVIKVASIALYIISLKCLSLLK